MKKKIFLKLLISILLILGTIQIKPATADNGSENYIYIPAFINRWPYLPSFGVEMNSLHLLDEAQEANNYWVRHNGLEWSKVQPNDANHREWGAVSELEKGLKDASAKGMEVILVVRSTPTWAQKVPGSFCGPMKQSYFDEFAAFMNKVVTRYSAAPYNVKYYEIWNEPDAPLIAPDKPWGCWGDPGAPYFGGGYYAEMLKIVYPEIKKANAKAQVLVGGLLLDCDPRKPGEDGYCQNATAAKPPTFIEGILENGGGAYFDALSFHGYAQYSSKQSAIQSELRFPNWKANGGVVMGKLDYLNELLVRYKLDKPIFLTEVGLQYIPQYEGDTPTVAFEQAKADYVAYLYARNLARQITGTTWYSFAGQWRAVGMLDSNFQPLPAYNAYKFLTTTLDEAYYHQDLDLGKGIIGFEFWSFQPDKVNRIWTLFSEDGKQKSINPPQNIDGVYDLFGTPVGSSGSQITFSRPIYIIFNN